MELVEVVRVARGLFIQTIIYVFVKRMQKAQALRFSHLYHQRIFHVIVNANNSTSASHLFVNIKGVNIQRFYHLHRVGRSPAI